MMRRHLLSSRLLALLLLLSLLAAACGGGDDTSDDTDEPTEAAQADDEDDEEATEEEATEDEDPKTEADIPTPEATSEPPAPTPRPTRTPRPTPEPAPTTEAPTTPPAAPGDSALGDAGDDMGVGGATSYDSYTVVTDDTGAIQVEIPTEWAQVDGRPYNDDAGRQFYDVRASTDLEGFATTWNVPGIIVNASTDAAQSQNEVALLDERVDVFSSVCTYVGRQPYDDGVYTGQADVFENCAGTDTGYLILGAVPTSRAFLIRVEVQVVEERDIEALGRALASFVIVGDV